jgi:hypothetical protein
VDAQWTVIVTALVMAIVMAWLAHINSLWQVYAFVVVYGLANGGIVRSSGALYVYAFKVTHIGKIMGMIFPRWAIGAAIGLFIVGALFDFKGNCMLAFWVAAIAMYRSLDGNF